MHFPNHTGSYYVLLFQVINIQKTTQEVGIVPWVWIPEYGRLFCDIQWLCLICQNPKFEQLVCSTVTRKIEIKCQECWGCGCHMYMTDVCFDIDRKEITIGRGNNSCLKYIMLSVLTPHQMRKVDLKLCHVILCSHWTCYSNIYGGRITWQDVAIAILTFVFYMHVMSQQRTQVILKFLISQPSHACFWHLKNPGWIKM